MARICRLYAAEGLILLKIDFANVADYAQLCAHALQTVIFFVTCQACLACFVQAVFED